MRVARSMVWLLLAACLLALPGCFAVENLDRFQGCPAGYTSLDLALTGVDAYTMSGMPNRLEIGVVDESGNITSRVAIRELQPSITDSHIQVPCFLSPTSRQLAVGVHPFDGGPDGTQDPATDDPFQGDGSSTTWAVTANASGHAALDLAMDPADSPASTYPRADGHHDLMFVGTGFAGPHHGQLFELRVTDTATSEVVGQYVLPAIPNTPMFQARLSGILQEGRKYTIDFFADANNSGGWDPPPTQSNPGGDHQWRVHLTATSDEPNMLAYMHVLDFTNIHFSN